MFDLPDRPAIGPYALTRELTPCTAFLGEPAGPDAAAERQRHTSALVRSAAGMWKAVMHLAHADSPGAPPARVSPRSDIRVGPHAPPAHAAAPARFLALHLAEQSSHVAYRFPPLTSAAAEARFRAAVERVRTVRHPHILAIEHTLFDAAGHAWLFTPFTGDVDGLRSLARLLREKNGQLSPIEAERALIQLFEALVAAHDSPSPVHHGPIRLDQVLVDRHGSLAIELFGLAHALRAGEPDSPARPPALSSAELRRDEVRSVVEIGYQLVTGLRAEAPLIPAGRLVHRLDPRWDRWFDRGLDPARGFDSAAAAIAELPSLAAPPVEQPRPAVTVRAMSRLKPTRS